MSHPLRRPLESRRPYRQQARAADAERMRARILSATAALLETAAGPSSLEAFAKASGATVPTVLRHFGSKDRLVTAALTTALERVRAGRPRVAAGDPRAAARVLAAEFERHGRLLRAVEALPADAREGLDAAHRLHRDWLARTFAPSLSPLAPGVHRRRLAQLVAVSGPAPWWALRETEHLSTAQAEAALGELLRALSS